MENKTIITISRQFGSGGREIGKKIADQLGIPFYDKELIEIAAKESGMDKELFEEDDART
ncbi:MAG: AAA family ATPase, partial [Clostridium sp.]